MKKYKISRSAIELFLECPRCFFLKYKKGISRPSSPPFTLNLEVDKLLKKEFDQYRSTKTQHPTQKNNNLDCIPAQNPNLEKWRHNFTGIQYNHPQTELLLYGSIDDLWYSPSEQSYVVVDYKATSSKYMYPSKERIAQYTRQLSFYAWLLSKNNLPMSNRSYILLYNAYSEGDSFGSKLSFKEQLITLNNSYDWIEPTIKEIKSTLSLSEPPNSVENCKYCIYFDKIKYINQVNSLPF